MKPPRDRTRAGASGRRRHAGRGPRAERRRQRGAALLVAMLIVSLVTTLAAGMVWRQWRSAEVETALRARVQGAWLLLAAQDWARLILREDARSGKPTSLSESWATPLQESRLSSFLAADREHADDDALQAFVSGRIVDAQSRYNLRNLVVAGKVAPEQLAILGRLCELAGLDTGIAQTIAAQWQAALTGAAGAPLLPAQFDDLAWFGLPPQVLDALRPFIVVLPGASAVDLNTAPREVLAAVIPGIDLGGADRLVQQRQREPFKTVDQARAALGLDQSLPPRDLTVQSSYFEAEGRLRIDERVIGSTALLERRNGLEVALITRSLRPTLQGMAGP